MTAEEKLSQIKKEEERCAEIGTKFLPDNIPIYVAPNGRVHISAEDIDLIADLVVERLNGSRDKVQAV